jgi:8-oxo-dGTP pyrophosphatase MutT (NUDIX family)
VASFRIPVSAATRSRLPGVRGRVDLTDQHVRIRLGQHFVAIVPRRSIRSAEVVRTARWIAPGASAHHGGWVVHGRPGGAVTLRFKPAASVRANGSSARTHAVTVGVSDPEALVAALGHGPVRVVRYEAAGCIVVRDDGRVLALARRGEVRLPKGHIDPGETPAVTAVRELAEESGYDDVVLGSLVGSGPVAFDRVDGDGPVRIERTEHWYLARLVSERRAEQPEGDLDWERRWLAWDEAIATLTYDGERGWAERARSWVVG